MNLRDAELPANLRTGCHDIVDDGQAEITTTSRLSRVSDVPTMEPMESVQVTGLRSSLTPFTQVTGRFV
jgi:hypothetical protein